MESARLDSIVAQLPASASRRGKAFRCASPAC